MQVKKFPASLFLLLLAGLLLTAAFFMGAGPQRQYQRLADQAVHGGLPQATAHLTVQLLRNPGFVIGYSNQHGNALWVSYQARIVPNPQFPKRPAFAPDERSQARLGPQAYTGSGYQRGHLAPNFLISNLHGRDGQRASFLMTNIAPQTPRLNQLLWQRLEEIEVDYMARRWGPIGVTVGPIFDDRAQRLSGAVAVPDAFYRLWLDRTRSAKPRALAFRVPQQVRGDEPLSAFITSVDRIEAATGLDFYPDLPDAMEQAMESVVAKPSDWAFDSVACAPARYHEDWQGRGGIHLRYDRCGE